MNNHKPTTINHAIRAKFATTNSSVEKYNSATRVKFPTTNLSVEKRSGW